MDICCIWFRKFKLNEKRRKININFEKNRMRKYIKIFIFTIYIIKDLSYKIVI